MPAVSPPATTSNFSPDTASAISLMISRRSGTNVITLRQSTYTGLAHPEVSLNGFSRLHPMALMEIRISDARRAFGLMEMVMGAENNTKRRGDKEECIPPFPGHV